MKKSILIMIVLLFTGIQMVLAQAEAIRGKVLDDKGEPVIGATIRVKNTARGTVTDANGNFKINAEDGESLTFSAIGMKATEKAAQDGMVVKLVADQFSLRETVVTAQAIKREKASLGYATATVTNDELNKGNNISALGALTGKVSGVNITNTTGGIGGSTRVVIRGEKSIGNNNNALIVIDGIPVNNGNRLRPNSLQQVDFGNRGNDVNPDDIESISVLKGAAATALYGSEGANGAIMITTKSGKAKSRSGKAEVGFSTGYTRSRVLMYPKFQNQYGQGDLHGVPDDRRENFSWGLPFDGQLRPWGQIIDGNQKIKPYVAIEDNVKDFFRTGEALENNLSLSGGTEKSNYFLSFNSSNATGVIPNTFADRYSIRVNANHEFANNFFSSFNVNYINGVSRLDQGGQGDGSVWNNVCQQPRDIPITNLANMDDKFNSMDFTDSNGVRRFGYYGAYVDNPYYTAQYYDNRNKFDRVIGQTTVGWRMNQHFTLSNRFGGEVISDRIYLKTPKINTLPVEEEFWGPGGPKSVAGGYFESTDNFNSYFNDLMLNINYQIDKLGINALIGNSVSSRRSNYLSSEIDPVSNGLVIENFYNFQNATDKITSENILTRSRKVGIYGSLNFDFDKFLFIELTARNDWSSTLAKEYRSYFYPGASVSWLFSQHFSDAARRAFNHGKLRASITSVGNDALAYQNNNPGFSSSVINSGFGENIFPFNGEPGYTYDNVMGNPALRNERQNAKEIGFEVGLLEDRIQADFTVYSSLQKDQILRVPLPASSGYTFRIINAGEVRNTGFEARLQISPIKQKNNGLRWDLFGTYTRNKNEVVSLPDGVDQVVIGGFSGMSIVAAVGKPMGTFYAVDLAKDAQGRQIIDTLTGNPLSTTTPTYFGSYQPKFIASWGTTVRYKGFFMNVLFDTKQGGYFYSRTKDILEFVGVTPTTTVNDRQPYIWDNSVVKNAAGEYVTNTEYKTDPYFYYTSANVKPVSQDLVKAGYIKLREIAIGYAMPARWFKNTFIGSGNVSLFGNNLAIWTNRGNDYVDPEVNSGGASNEQGFDFSARPSVKNYGFKVGLTF